MAVDLKAEPNYEPVIQALREATAVGKLKWQETAEPGTFIASAKGQRAFEFYRSRFSPAIGSTQSPRLVVKNETGSPLFEIGADRYPPLNELYDLAARQARGVDDRINETVQLLREL